MRRLASLLVARHSVDKPDSQLTTSSNDPTSIPQDPNNRKPRILSSLSRKSPLPQLSAHSSSSASSTSAELPTPDELLPRTLSQKASWKPWLGAKKHKHQRDPKAACLSPLPTSGIALHPPPRSNDTDDDTSSESEDDEPYHSSGLNVHTSITQARNNMRAIILDSSADRSSCHPLLDISDSTPFPRSCLRSTHVRRLDTLESKMHKTALLRMLECLSPPQERSIAHLGRRPMIFAKEAHARNPDIDTCPKSQFLRRSSRGLGNWVTRPCFEDRVLVWTRQELSGQMISTNVTGSSFGVAALEFSEPLQILAGLLSDTYVDSVPSAELQPSPPDSGLAAVASISTEQLTALVAIPVTLAADSPEASGFTMETARPKAAEPTPASFVKRGVRFAEDGKDDQIPLGYVLRIKKKREEKARFLREEREKRELEEERRTRDEEHRARLWEAEKREQEKERKARELQKKKMEAERRQENYAAELQASRARREASRAGHTSSSSSSLVRDMERDRSASRDSRPPGSLSARQRTLDLVASASDGSPASSMPATPGSQLSFSRPPSVYSNHTTSSEDIRARDGRRISKRSSLAFDPSKQPPLPLPNPRVSLLPYNSWTTNAPISLANVPMTTSMPFYPLDIPLLPPSPPFMMDQLGTRTRSTNSSQGQISSSPRNHNSSNSSVEGNHNTSSHLASNSPRFFPTHQRRASDETRGHSSSTKALADRKYESQTDLRDKRSSQVAHFSRGSNLHRSHQPHALVHTHTVPIRPASMSQSRWTPNRRQSVYT